MPALLDRSSRQSALLAELAEVEAEDARLYARRMRIRGEMEQAWQTGDGPEQFGVLELAGTARIGQTRAGTQLSDGQRLREVLPDILGLLGAGVMFRETAVLFLQLTAPCSEQVQREVAARLFPDHAQANTADLRRVVVETVLEVEADLDPALTQDRLDLGRQRRRVWVRRSQGLDGLNEIVGALEDAPTRRWVLDFEELVRAQRIVDRKRGVSRTVDQVRADLFATLPSQVLALIRAIQKGNTAELLALAQHDPDFADSLEALAAVTPAEDAPLADSPVEDATEAPDPPEATDPPAAAAPGDPPDPPRPPTWEELVVAILGLPVRDPRVMNIHIPMTTMLDLDNRAGYIEGLGPIPAEHARLLMPYSGLRRVCVDPASGTPIGIDPDVQPALLDESESVDHETAEQVRRRLLALLGPAVVVDKAQPQHDPSRLLDAFIRMRDQRCGAPGCSCIAGQCHLDHEIRWPEGPTAAWNLGAKSPRCHRAKHTGWRTERHPDGSTTWTSPLGHSYHRPGVWRAPPYVPHDLQLPPARLPQVDGVDLSPLGLPLWLPAAEAEDAFGTDDDTASGQGWDEDPPL